MNHRSSISRLFSQSAARFSILLASIVFVTTSSANAGVIIPGLVDNDLTDPTDSGTLTGTETTSAEKAGQGGDKAFDNIVSSGNKWYTDPVGSPFWIQFQFDNPVAQHAVNRYTITTAGDVAGRDPDDWQFQGSNDGSSWVDVDVQTGQAANWTARLQTQDFQFTNNTAYEYYRFLITKTRSNTSDLQVSEIELFNVPPVPAPEPSSFALATLAVLSLGFVRRRRRR